MGKTVAHLEADYDESVCCWSWSNRFPVAQYVSEKGLQVWGIDINPKTVENANNLAKFKATTSWKEIPQCDIYIIAVTTGQKNQAPDLSAVLR